MRIEYKEKNHQRIDKFLKERKIEELYSRSFIDKLIIEEYIKVNGNPVKKSHLLKSGDIIKIDIPQPESLEIIPENIPINILWEDEYLVIVNKPAGMIVHPGAGNPDGTLVNALMYHLKGNLSSGSDVLRPGIVHRLDKDTTGLLIAAKDDRTHSLLSQMFQDRKIKKTYLAITVGAPAENHGTIETNIERSSADRKKMTVSENGKKAVTHYKILEHYDFFSVMELGLETGRTHQIRVHFSSINCPILGDDTYSSLKRTLNIIPSHFHKKIKHLLANHLKRQALHAYKLKLVHPITGKEINVEAPLPQDIKYTLDWLKKSFNTE
ncbi:MAG: RluA family pseudouridine synthase [Candidatus Cloacimonetes bacterium]|nr:RluA family pseudouridine synthase [Candidatus Cloacimonadota bacterium]